MKILIIIGECEVIVERGACFHPTIGTTTLDGFTTGHPQDRPIISPCSTTVRDGGYSPPPIGNWKLIFST
jgi:hypothetical protein